MKRLRLISVIAILMATGMLAVATAAGAQTGGGYDLTWSTVDGGGGSSTGGAYTVEGTLGQADAGSQGGGDYTLAGGFWGAVQAVLRDLFLPLVQR
jgi:hypothetical protein